MPPARSVHETIEGHRVTLCPRPGRPGRWEFVYTDDGKRVRLTGGATIEAAREAARAHINGAHYEQQGQEARRGITVGDCTRHYMAVVKRQGRQHSINTATRMVDAITGRFGERMLARSLTQSAVQQFIDSASTAGEGAKRRRYLAAALRSRLRALPCEFPKAPTDHDAPTREALDAHQVALLLKSARDMDDQVHALLQLAAGTGVRHREATSRTWADLDLEKGRLRIAPQPRAAFRLKTKAARRTVHLPNVTLDAMRSWRLHWELAHKHPPTGTDWLFPDSVHDEQPWDQGRCCRAVRAVFEDAGLGDLHGAGLHALRRSWATAALNAGASFPAVQAAGGWASPQVLLAHYARSTEDAQHELAMGVGARLLEG